MLLEIILFILAGAVAGALGTVAVIANNKKLARRLLED